MIDVDGPEECLYQRDTPQTCGVMLSYEGCRTVDPEGRMKASNPDQPTTPCRLYGERFAVKV